MESIVDDTFRTGTVSLKDNLRTIILDLMVRYDLDLSEEEIKTLSEYLTYYNYFIFNEIYTYNNSLLIEIESTTGEIAYLKYDSKTLSIMFIDENVMIDFTNKESLDIINTPNGRIVAYSFNNFNTALFFDEERASNLIFGPHRELEVPKGVNPTKIIDLSTEKDDFYKLLTIKSHLKIIKTKKESLYGKI